MRRPEVKVPAAITCLTSGLWHGLRLVAPGQPAVRRARMMLLLPRHVAGDLSHARAVASALRPGSQSLLVVDDRLLDPTGDSASHRLAWVLRMADGLGWAASFYSVRTRSWFNVAGDATLVPSGPKSSADVVWIVRPEAGSIVLSALSSLRPQLGVVYDSMDLHHLRLARESAVTGSRGVALQVPLMRTLERLLASHADVVVAISDEERDGVARLAGAAQVLVLPNIHQPREDESPPLEDRSGIVFVGNFSHMPNVDAFEVLAREVMPRLWRQRPDLVLSVVGRGFPEDYRRVDPRIVVRGWLERLDPVLDSSCLLVAPLRFGAGLKGKIGYAFARGLPVVTTPCGAEGFPETTAMAVAPEGDWDAFAEATLELLRSDELWAQKSEAGIELTRREFAPTVLKSRLEQILHMARRGLRSATAGAHVLRRRQRRRRLVLTPAATSALLLAVWLGKAIAHHDYDLI